MILAEDREKFSYLQFFISVMLLSFGLTHQYIGDNTAATNTTFISTNVNAPSTWVVIYRFIYKFPSHRSRQR